MEVNVTRRIETPNGNRYCSVVVNGSGRIKPDWVIVNGSGRIKPDWVIVNGNHEKHGPPR